MKYFIRKHFFCTYLYCTFSQTMIKNHKVFGNTSILTLVGRVILLDLLVNAQQIIKGCYSFRESSTILGYNKPWTCY